LWYSIGSQAFSISDGPLSYFCYPLNEKCSVECLLSVPQVQQLDSKSAQNIESVGTLYVMKSRPLKNVVVDSIYKSKDVAAQRREDMFPEVKDVSF